MTYMTLSGQESYGGMYRSYSRNRAGAGHSTRESPYLAGRDLDMPVSAPDSAYQTGWKSDRSMYESSQIVFGTGADPGKYSHGEIDLRVKIDR